MRLKDLQSEPSSQSHDIFGVINLLETSQARKISSPDKLERSTFGRIVTVPNLMELTSIHVLSFTQSLFVDYLDGLLDRGEEVVIFGWIVKR